ncbi:MAG: copper amine oxidase N-terminal domain-containing protein [Cellulosilyticaceae bacterium]
MSKRIMAGILAMGMLVGNIPLYGSEYVDDFVVEQKKVEISLNGSQMVIDGVQYSMDDTPKVIGGTTYLPINVIAQYVLGGKANWYPTNRIVVIEAAGKKIQMQVDETKVIVDGEPQTLVNMPKMINNRVWIPLKEVASILEMPLIFDNTNKKVHIGVVGEGFQNTQPMADFSFGEASYIEGQTPVITEACVDEDGDTLIKWQWQVNGGQILYSIEEVKEALRVGQNQIALRVQDSKKAWSEWTGKTLEIKPNAAPVITELKADKGSFKRGEAIKFTFEYENEEWEDVVEEKWSYRRTKDAVADAIEAKPEKLFYEGEFMISLSLKDAHGNWSKPSEMKLKVGKEIVQSEMEYAFKEAPTGTILQNYNQYNFNNYEAVKEPEIIQTGSTLMMSNSPEGVYTPGILYQDTLQDEIRVLYHHKNIMKNATGTERLVVVVENTNDKPILVVRKRQGNKGPANDVLHIGQQTLYDYLGDTKEVQYTLAPGQKMYLFNSGDKKWRQDETVSGLIDLYCQQPLKVTVATIRDNHTLADIDRLPYLQKDGVHTRGTFPNADHYYTFDIEEKITQKLVLGLKAVEGPPWLEGYDAITGEDVQNKGNYGVRYHLRMTAKENTGLIINPRGGVFKGAIGWRNDKSYLAPKSHLNNGMQAATIGGISKGESKELYYMLPNGSSAPVLIGFIPESQWRNHE